MKADGQSLLFVTIEVVDKEGRVVPEAQQPLDVKVNGSGTLLAVGNANPRDNDPYYDAKHSTWNGRALAVVRSNGKRGAATISVTSPKFGEAKLKVKSE